MELRLNFRPTFLLIIAVRSVFMIVKMTTIVSKQKIKALLAVSTRDPNESNSHQGSIRLDSHLDVRQGKRYKRRQNVVYSHCMPTGVKPATQEPSCDIGGGAISYRSCVSKVTF